MTNSPVQTPTAVGVSVAGAQAPDVQVPVVTSVGATVSLPPVSKVTRVLDRSLANDSEWYLKREGELVDVTNEASNPLLGINNITVRPATDKQMEYYTIANVTLDTVLGVITGAQIKESQREAGAIYFQAGSHNTAKADQPAKWVSDVKFNRAVQAQILSYVHTMLVPK